MTQLYGDAKKLHDIEGRLTALERAMTRRRLIEFVTIISMAVFVAGTAILGVW